MTSAAEPTVAREDATLSATRAATVFGVHWRSSLPLAGFVADGRASEGDSLVLAASPRALRVGWERAETIFCQRLPRGRPMFVVERNAEAYRIRALRYGINVIADDGRSILCAPPRQGDWRWQRLLFSHSLPLAAQLQGLHVLHASAVCVGDAAAAFLAPSGTGKSTLAANLVARGHSFLTDDVLAVSSSGSALIAHAGPQLLGLGVHDYERLTDEGRQALGAPIGSLDKLYFATPARRGFAPLRLLYFLERGNGSRLEISDQDPAQPASLLAGTVVTYLQTERRLIEHLDFCAALAARTRVFTLRMPAEGQPERVAAALEAHILEAAQA